MQILFVAKGQDNDHLSPVIASQGKSLKEIGHQVDYFLIRGPGLAGYVTESIRLRNFVKALKPDIVHAHYVLSGLTTVLSNIDVPKILSFMGSDLFGEFITERNISFRSKWIVRLSKIVQRYFSAIVVKSDEMSKKIKPGIQRYVVPNGVDLYYNKLELDILTLKEELGLKPSASHILWLNNPANVWKNFELAKKAISKIATNSWELITPYPIDHQSVYKYLMASNVLLLTSYKEGSPNVIKEAMACNCPIVSTDVGDVKWVIGNTEGCYITSFEPEDVAEKIKLAVQFAKEKGRTKGRERILELGLDSETVAKKLVNIYKEVLEKNR